MITGFKNHFICYLEGIRIPFGGGVLIEPSGETRENHTGGIDDAPETEGTTTMPVASQQNQEEVNEVPHKP